MKFSCDIGCWERGEIIELEASTLKEAIEKAVQHIKVNAESILERTRQRSVDEIDIVQIHAVIGEKKICVYDYMNWSRIYKDEIAELGI